MNLKNDALHVKTVKVDFVYFKVHVIYATFIYVQANRILS